MAQAPRLVVKPPREYVQFCHLRLERSEIWYWHLTWKLGLGDRFMPRAWYSPADHAIYVDSRHRDNHKLVAHEFAHSIGLHHPTAPIAALKHAWATRFSFLSFTGLLRWTKKPGAIWFLYESWLQSLAEVSF